MKKAQISLEYITIIGIALTLTTIIASLFFSFSSYQKDDLDSKQIDSIFNDVITTSEEIYFRGSGNKVQIKAQFPENIENISIVYDNSGSVNFTYINITTIGEELSRSSLYETSQNYIFLNCSDCTHNGNVAYYSRDQFSAGPKTLSIRSIGDQVLIDFVR